MLGRAIKLMVKLVMFLLALRCSHLLVAVFSDRPENQIDPVNP